MIIEGAGSPAEINLSAGADRERIRGFIVNKVRGDAALLAPAPAILHERTGVPTPGVVPHLRLDLPEEDAASLSDRGARGEIGTAAVRLPHIRAVRPTDRDVRLGGQQVRASKFARRRSEPGSCSPGPATRPAICAGCVVSLRGRG